MSKYFYSNHYNCPKLQKKDRKRTKNKRKKVPLAERNGIVRSWKINFISQRKKRNYF